MRSCTLDPAALPTSELCSSEYQALALLVGLPHLCPWGASEKGAQQRKGSTQHFLERRMKPKSFFLCVSGRQEEFTLKL